MCRVDCGGEDENARRDQAGITTFYWTIRSMTGPEIVKFRKLIRDEVGMENLR